MNSDWLVSVSRTESCLLDYNTCILYQNTLFFFYGIPWFNRPYFTGSTELGWLSLCNVCLYASSDVTLQLEYLILFYYFYYFFYFYFTSNSTKSICICLYAGILGSRFKAYKSLDMRIACHMHILPICISYLLCPHTSLLAYSGIYCT